MSKEQEKCHCNELGCKKCKPLFATHMTISDPLPEINGWEEEFDKKFPFRIYGVAGEPKTEFIVTENMPDKIKEFIRAHSQEIKRRVEELLQYQFSVDHELGRTTINEQFLKRKDVLDLLGSSHLR